MKRTNDNLAAGRLSKMPASASADGKANTSGYGVNRLGIQRNAADAAPANAEPLETPADGLNVAADTKVALEKKPFAGLTAEWAAFQLPVVRSSPADNAAASQQNTPDTAPAACLSRSKAQPRRREDTVLHEPDSLAASQPWNQPGLRPIELTPRGAGRRGASAAVPSRWQRISQGLSQNFGDFLVSLGPIHAAATLARRLGRRTVILLTAGGGVAAIIVFSLLIRLASSGGSGPAASASAAPRQLTLPEPARQPGGHPVEQTAAVKPAETLRSQRMASAATAPAALAIRRSEPAVPVSIAPVAEPRETSSRRLSTENSNPADRTNTTAVMSIDSANAASAEQSPTSPAFRAPPPGFRLTGVINSPGGAYAAINGRLIRVGAVINGAKLVAIHSFSAEMEMDDGRFMLGIGSDDSSDGQDQDASSDSPPADAKAASPSADGTETPSAAEAKPAQPAQDAKPAPTSTYRKKTTSGKTLSTSTG